MMIMVHLPEHGLIHTLSFLNFPEVIFKVLMVCKLQSTPVSSIPNR